MKVAEKVTGTHMVREGVEAWKRESARWERRVRYWRRRAVWLGVGLGAALVWVAALLLDGR